MSYSGKSPRPFDAEAQERYCAILRETGEEIIGRVEVGVSRSTLQHLRKTNEEFAELERDALRVYRAKLAQEIYRRGFSGVQEAIYYKGTVVGHKVVYSDALLLEHVRRHDKRYAARSRVDSKSEVSVRQVDLSPELARLSPEDRATIRAILERNLAKAQDEDRAPTDLP